MLNIYGTNFEKKAPRSFFFKNLKSISNDFFHDDDDYMLSL